MEKYSKAKLCERAAYVRGLAEGLLGSENDSHSRVLSALLEVVEDIARTVDNLNETVSDLAQQVDEIDDDLAAVEDEVYGDAEDCCCGTCHGLEGNVTCPSCNEVIVLDEELLNKGYVSCPNCDELLEFNMDDIEEEN